jgi:hypothetical protein
VQLHDCTCSCKSAGGKVLVKVEMPVPGAAKLGAAKLRILEDLQYGD